MPGCYRSELVEKYSLPQYLIAYYMVTAGLTIEEMQNWEAGGFAASGGDHVTLGW